MVIIPPPIRDILRQLGPQVVLTGIDCRAAFVIKLDKIERAGPIPVSYGPELGLYATGAVLQFVVTLRDGLQTLRLECYLNPAEIYDVAVASLLASQETVEYHFYDALLGHRWSQSESHPLSMRRRVDELLERALEHQQSVVETDFARARQMMRADRTEA